MSALWRSLLSDDEDVAVDTSVSRKRSSSADVAPVAKSAKPATAPRLAVPEHLVAMPLSRDAWVPRLLHALAPLREARGQQTQCFRAHSACSGTGAPFIALKARRKGRNTKQDSKKLKDTLQLLGTERSSLALLLFQHHNPRYMFGLFL